MKEAASTYTLATERSSKLSETSYMSNFMGIFTKVKLPWFALAVGFH